MDWHECIEHHDTILQTIVCVICVKTLTWWCQKKNTLINSDASDELNDDLLCIKDIIKIKRLREAYKVNKCKRKQMLNEYRHKVQKKI